MAQKDAHTANGKQDGRYDEKKRKDLNIASIQCIHTHDEHGYYTKNTDNQKLSRGFDEDAPAMIAWTTVEKYS